MDTILLIYGLYLDVPLIGYLVHTLHLVVVTFTLNSQQFLGLLLHGK